jgi:hypothetical protein
LTIALKRTWLPPLESGTLTSQLYPRESIHRHCDPSRAQSPDRDPDHALRHRGQAVANRDSSACGEPSTRVPDDRDEHLELPVEEVLRRGRPRPPHDEMVIEDLGEEEGAAFLAAVES